MASLFDGDISYTTGPSTSGNSNIVKTGGQEVSDQYTGNWKGLSDWLANFAKGVGQGTTPTADGGAADASQKAQDATNPAWLAQQQQYANQAAGAAGSSQYFNDIMASLMGQNGWNKAAYDANSNPYTQAVVNTTLQGMDDKAAQNSAALAGNLAGNKAFGVRGQVAQALQTSEADKARAAQQAQLQAAAYDSAQSQFNKDQDRSLQGNQAALQGDLQNTQSKITGANSAAQISQGGMKTFMDSLATQAGISTTELEQQLASAGFDLNKIKTISDALASAGTKKETTVEQGRINQSSSSNTEVPDVPDIIDDILDGRDPDATGTDTPNPNPGTDTGAPNPNPGTDTGTPNPNPGTGTGTDTPNPGTGTGTDTLPDGWTQVGDNLVRDATGNYYDNDGNPVNSDGTPRTPDPIDDGNGNGDPLPDGWTQVGDNLIRDAMGNYYDNQGNPVNSDGTPRTTPDTTTPGTGTPGTDQPTVEDPGIPAGINYTGGFGDSSLNKNAIISGVDRSLQLDVNAPLNSAGNYQWGNAFVEPGQSYVSVYATKGIGMETYRMIPNPANGTVTMKMNDGTTVAVVNNPELFQKINAIVSRMKTANSTGGGGGFAKGGFFEVGKVSGRLDDSVIEGEEELDDDTLEEHAEIALQILSSIMDDDEAERLLIKEMESGLSAIQAAKAIMVRKGIAHDDDDTKEMAQGGYFSDITPGEGGAWGGFKTGLGLPRRLINAFGNSLIPTTMWPDASEPAIVAANSTPDNALASAVKNQRNSTVDALASNPTAITSLGGITPASLSAPTIFDAPAERRTLGAFDVDPQDSEADTGEDIYSLMAQGILGGAGANTLDMQQGIADSLAMGRAAGEDLSYNYNTGKWWDRFSGNGMGGRERAEAMIASGFADSPWGQAAKGLLALQAADEADYMKQFEVDKLNRDNRRLGSKNMMDIISTGTPLPKQHLEIATLLDPRLRDVMEVGLTKDGLVGNEVLAPAGISVPEGVDMAAPLRLGDTTIPGMTNADFYSVTDPEKRADLKIRLLSTKDLKTEVTDADGVPVAGPGVAPSGFPAISMTAAGDAARSASSGVLKALDWGDLAGTNEGDAKENYDSKGTGWQFSLPLIGDIGSNDPFLIGGEAHEAAGKSHPAYKNVHAVASKLGGTGLATASEVIKPMSNTDSDYGRGLSSGVMAGEDGFLEALSFEQRTLAFDKFAKEVYAKEKDKAAAAGKKIVPYNQFSKDLYKGFELTRTNENGLPVFQSTRVPLQTEVDQMIKNLPPGVKEQVDAATSKLSSGNGSMPEIKLLEETLGNGAWLYYMK